MPADGGTGVAQGRGQRVIESMTEANRGGTGDRRAGAGGRRLAAAFDKVSDLPALGEARRRLLLLCDRQAASPTDIAEAVESDAALAITVMTAANNGNGPAGR